LKSRLYHQVYIYIRQTKILLISSLLHYQVFAKYQSFVFAFTSALISFSLLTLLFNFRLHLNFSVYRYSIACFILVLNSLVQPYFLLHFDHLLPQASSGCPNSSLFFLVTRFVVQLLEAPTMARLAMVLELSS